jgi:dihydropteroate synthase
MHAQGVPASMQDDPRYADVLLDVYDSLATRLARAEALGIDRTRIVLDPGIGFGKTLAHNLLLLRGLSLFHGLGCPILLGTSRKRFIGTIGQAPDPQDRAPGSIATAMAGVAQGVQIVRVHDVPETRQALRLWHALNTDSLETDT